MSDKGARIVVPDFGSDHADVEVVPEEEILCLSHPQARDEFHWRHLKVLFEKPAEVVLAEMGLCCKLFQCDIGGKVVSDVADAAQDG